MRTSSCRYCGVILEPRATYCSDCGARVRGDGNPPTAGRLVRAALLTLLAVPSVILAVLCVLCAGSSILSGYSPPVLYAAIAGWLCGAALATALVAGLVLLAAEELSGRRAQPRGRTERRRWWRPGGGRR
ncbi:MAG: hypothetical protein HYU66_25925 [Armatimonadetes bacterium]|nr:hypothetical protein [Armatimonadota bacterium]